MKYLKSIQGLWTQVSIIICVWSNFTHISSQNIYSMMREDNYYYPSKNTKYKTADGLEFILPFKYPKGTIITWHSNGSNSNDGKLSMTFDKKDILIPQNNSTYMAKDATTNKYTKIYPNNFILSVEGDFASGKCIKGKIDFINGDNYIGDLNDWNLHGEGILTNAIGIKRDGSWDNGIFIDGTITGKDGELLQKLTFKDLYKLPYKEYKPETEFVVTDIYALSGGFDFPKYGEIKNINIQDLLIAAIKAKDSKQVVDLINKGANVNYGETYRSINLPLSTAIHFDCLECIEAMLPKVKNVGAGFRDGNRSVWNPLIAASEKSLTLLERLFKDFNANPNSVFLDESSFSPVLIAVRNFDAFKMFLKYGANPYMYSGAYQEGVMYAELPLIFYLARYNRDNFINHLLELEYNPSIQEKILASFTNRQFIPYQSKLVTAGSHEGGTLWIPTFIKLLQNGSAFNVCNISTREPNQCCDHHNSLLDVVHDPKLYSLLLKLGVPCKTHKIGAIYEREEYSSELDDSQVDFKVKELLNCNCDW